MVYRARLRPRPARRLLRLRLRLRTVLVVLLRVAVQAFSSVLRRCLRWRHCSCRA